MSNHTPGPWHVDDDRAMRTRDGQNVVDAFDHRVVWTDADAAAISAVPELLALADAVIAAVYAGREVPAHLLRMAHIAQAKAMGEIP